MNSQTDVDFGLGRGVGISRDGKNIIAKFDKEVGTWYSGFIVYHNRDGNGWTEVQRIIPSGIASSGDFLNIDLRRCLSDDGNYIAIGVPTSPITKGGGVDRGKIYIYEFDGNQYQEVQVISSPLDVAKAYFGYGVAISGDGSKVLGFTGSLSSSPDATVFVYEAT